MKKDEKNGSSGRTIRTRSRTSSPAEQGSLGSKTSNQGTPSKKQKLIPPASSTRKSERLASSPASVTTNSGKIEKQTRASPSQRCYKGKNVASENSKGSEKSGGNADTSSHSKESKDILMNNIEELRSKIKKQEPKMTARSYRALFRGALKKEVNDSVKDDELVVVGCSRRVPAENDDARDDNNSPHANPESNKLPAGATSLEKDTDSPVKFISDTEKIVLDACPMPETGNASVIGSSSENKTQKINDSSKEEELVVVGCSHRLPVGDDDARDDNISLHADPELKRLSVGSTTLEKDTDFPVELIRDTEIIVLDASPMPETDDASVIGSPSENLETPEINDSAKDEELVVVGCSRHSPAGNDDARDDNSSAHANTESKKLPVGSTTLEMDTDIPVKLTRDTETIVLDASPMPETTDASVIDSPCEKSKTQKINDSAKDEELVVVGCSRHLPAGNDNARDENISPHAHPESKRMPVDSTNLEKDTDFPVKLIRDTERIVLDASPVPETRDASVIDSPSENSETQKILASTTNLETNIDVPLKRKRDTAGIVLDACAPVANAVDCITSNVGVIPSPSECKNNNQPERCSRCEKRQKVNDDFENIGVCSCIVQPVQESYLVAQDTRESGPTTSRCYVENRKNMQQDKPYDPKLSSMYPEYWVPVQLSDVQLEQYCRILFSKCLSLSSLSKDVVGALEETLTSVRKVCDHPYVMDASMKLMLTKNLQLHEILDVEVKASGKLHLLDAMLTQIKANGLKVVVFYQTTQSPGGLLLANILEDFVSQRFGQKSYEHGVVLSKKNAINNFNKESECFVLLLETRACSQSIKLLRAEAFILFESSLNPSHDVKLLEKIKIESYSERTKIFRLYSTYTVEEKTLILARQHKWQNKPLENPTRPLTHALLMWGASYLFEKLDRFHGSETPHLGVPSEQSINDGVIHEFSSIISSKVGEEIEGKLCLLLEAKHAQGTYSTDSTLFGEQHVKLSDEDTPNIFWTKLLGGKNPRWKYCLDTSQRSRKRVQYLQVSEKTAQIGNNGNIKKRRKDSDHVTVDKDESKASEKDHMGTSMPPKVIALESSCRTASGPSGTSNGNNTFGLCSVGGHIPGVPEDMLACIDWRQTPPESQRNLHAVLKSEMAKLGKVLHLSEDATRMVEIILDYVIENYRVCREPATTLQAFQIALSWIATLMVEQKLNHKASLVLAKSDLAFSCCREEVDYIYSMLYCMKSLFVERLQGHQAKNNTRLMRTSEGEECITEKRGVNCSSVKKDIEKTLRDIKKKFNKQQQNLEQKHEEKKLEVVNKYTDKKLKLEDEKEIERAIIRIQCRWAATQSLEDSVKRLDLDHERKIDKITTERDEDLKKLEQMHETEKKMLAEEEASWISRVEKWAEAELLKCAPLKRGSNKHFSRIYSSNTCIYTPDVQICSDANGDATFTGTNCMVSKGNQVPEAENTLGTMSGGTTQQVHEMVASRNDKEMDVQPMDNAATKSQSNNNASITVPEILIPAGCQVEFPASNVQLSEPQICDRMTSAPADEDMTSAPEDEDVPLPEISKSSANLAKSASLDFSLNREEALVTVENNRPSQVETDSNNILDQQNEEARSLDKPVPDENVSPMPPPASVVETRGSTEFFQDDQDICHMPSPGDPTANIEGQHIEETIEPQPARSPMPSSPVGQQPDLAANIQGQNIEAAVEPQLAGSETVDTDVFAALEQDDQVACPLPSPLAENQPEVASNVEDQNINTSAEPHVAGTGAVEIGDSAVLDQQVTVSLPSSLVGTQADLAANTDQQSMTPIAHLNTAGSDAVEAGCSPASHQVASPLPLSSPRNHLDAAVNIEGLNNNTTEAEPHTTRADACEMEIAEPGPHVEQSTFTNNIAEVVHEGGVEPVPSLLNNVTGQSDAQQVPQIPFPVFNDPFQHELEKIRRESENTKKACDEKKSILKVELERKLAEIQAEYQRKFHEVEAHFTAKITELENNKNLIVMNKLLASAFLSKCTNKNNGSQSSSGPRGIIQQLAQRATQVSALRNHATTAPAAAPAPAPAPAPHASLPVWNYVAIPPAPVSAPAPAPASAPQASSRVWNYAPIAPAPVSAPAPAPLLPQPSSHQWNHAATTQAPAPATAPVPASLQQQASSRPLNLTQNSTNRPMPQPKQPLISNIAPSLSASPATSTRLRSPAPHINPYRPSSSISRPATTTTTTPTSLPLPQAVTYSTVTVQQQQQHQQEQQHQQQQENVSNNDVVCLSDDE